MNLIKIFVASLLVSSCASFEKAAPVLDITGNSINTFFGAYKTSTTKVKGWGVNIKGIKRDTHISVVLAIINFLSLFFLLKQIKSISLQQN